MMKLLFWEIFHAVSYTHLTLPTTSRRQRQMCIRDSFDASRFVWIKDYAELNENKRKVVLSHYPIACYNGQYRRDEDGNPKTFMLHGHIHATQDQQFLDAYQEYIHQQKHPRISDGQLEGVPCQLINCFCMYSDYVPMTLDEWIQIDKRRRNIL